MRKITTMTKPKSRISVKIIDTTNQNIWEVSINMICPRAVDFVIIEFICRIDLGCFQSTLDTYTHTNKHKQTQTNTQTHKHTNTHTNTNTHTSTHTHTLHAIDLCLCFIQCRRSSTNTNSSGRSPSRIRKIENIR